MRREETRRVQPEKLLCLGGGSILEGNILRDVREKRPPQEKDEIMLTSFTLKNFKSWREIKDMRLAPITVLFGPNSSGKSSILQFFLMLKQTVESPDPSVVLNFGGDGKGYTSLGNFKDMIFNHQTNDALFWSISWSGRQFGYFFHGKCEAKREDSKGEVSWEVKEEAMELSFEASISSEHQYMPFLESFFYQINDIAIGTRWSKEQNRYNIFVGPQQLIQQSRDGLTAPGTEENTVGYVLQDSNRSELKANLMQMGKTTYFKIHKFYAFPPHFNVFHGSPKSGTNIIAGLTELFESMVYLGPVRAEPKREYHWSGGRPNDVGKHGEWFTDVILGDRHQTAKKSENGNGTTILETRIAQWLKDLNLLQGFRLKELGKGSGVYQVQVRHSRKSPWVLLPDVGYGVSQIVPVMTLLLSLPPKSILLLEQPELHLHPAIQSKLGDLLISATKEFGHQIILESHSEHLLRRLQRRVAEGEKISSSDVALYFCENAGEESILKPLEMDEYGNILNWPKDFFGDELEDLEAKMNAIGRRKELVGSRS